MKRKMKRKMKRIGLVLGIVLFFSAFMLGGCSGEANITNEESQSVDEVEEITFVEGSHKREEGYEAAFNTYYSTIGNLEIHVMNRIYEEDSAKVLAEHIATDYQTLCAGAGDTGASTDIVRVYMVQVTVSGKPQLVGGSVFCTMEDVESGDYRECLTGAYFQADSHWKNIGLNAYLFGSTDNTDALKEYYANAENMEVLSMFPAFFSEDFADEETTQIAKQTASALTKYMVEELGMTEFLQTTELAKYCDAWMKSIGVVISTEQLPDDELHLMKYSSSEEYPVILEYENFTFYMKPVDWMMTADEAYNSVRDVLGGYAGFWADFEVSEPEASALIKKNFDTPMHIYLQNKSKNISHATRDNQIYISNVYAACHEMMHILLHVNDEDQQWYEEGLNTFLTYETEMFYISAEDKEPLFQLLTKGEIYQEASKENQEFMDYVAEYYLTYTPLPKTLEDMDFLSFYLAVGKTTLKYPNLPTELTMAITTIEERQYQVGTHGEKEIQSGDTKEYLTYPEATVCIEYLAKKYGLATVVSVAQDIAIFEETFGDVETVIEEVKANIAPIEE